MTPLVRRYIKTSFVFLLAGATAVRASAELWAGLSPVPALRLAIAAGGLGQLAGTVLFVLNMWRRVRTPPATTPPR